MTRIELSPKQLDALAACPECGCDCVDLKAKLDLAVTALRGFEALYTEIVDGKEAPPDGPILDDPFRGKD